MPRGKVTQVKLDVALAYYWEYTEEIDRFLQENNRPLEYWQKLHPGLNIEVHRSDDPEGE
jgi:hypothetical protein